MIIIPVGSIIRAFRRNDPPPQQRVIVSHHYSGGQARPLVANEVLPDGAYTDMPPPYAGNGASTPIPITNPNPHKRRYTPASIVCIVLSALFGLAIVVGLIVGLALIYGSKDRTYSPSYNYERTSTYDWNDWRTTTLPYKTKPTTEYYWNWRNNLKTTTPNWFEQFERYTNSRK